MPTEYEAKVLDIDPAQLAERITDAGGRHVGDRAMRRYVYDIVPGDLSKWIRLRDTGEESTLTVKEIHHDGIDGTHEVEVTVSDFAATNELLALLGFRPKSYQENTRSSYELDGAQVEIDGWPLIPPYLEIESDSREHVVAVAAKLGYDEDQLTGENTTKVYARYGIDLSTLPDLRFPQETSPTA